MRILQNTNDRINLSDPSLLLRPELRFATKEVALFRDYSEDDEDPIKRRVKQTYRQMHLNQTMEFVEGRMYDWLRFNHFQGDVRSTLERLNDLVDESDPDVDLPNIVHAFQTAERIRADHPSLDWFHLTGLIHDLGKVMAFYGEPQWACVGDTFPVGCAWSANIVYGRESFRGNPDGDDERYNSLYGKYSPHCGLDEVTMSWGHDEYLYRVLVHNGSKLPREALNMIRYHSFYPWHSAGDYEHLCCEADGETKKWVLEFNKYDLYSKSEDVPDIEQLWPYYQGLIDEYIPGILEW